ncbi:MAG: hypothetical protein Q7S93_11450 [Phenylobacterium sp.]|uniref:hypothetical protein n=1 Tax=Phenylobacterium sp. TaxID=1871053 RepID=UPI002720D166|nr:hypothetical protein [Phenylobacterium sp.]MDO8410661.1 hypothetical protein [Phenylobacterium sp.]
MAFHEAISDDLLKRRRLFCEARVKARAEAEREGSTQLIVAGLHKELAAIALLQGDLEDGRKHLAEAGELLVRQNVAHGLVLLGLAGTHRVLDDALARKIADVAAHLDEAHETVEARVRGAAFYSPIQWLAVIQASVLAHTEGVDVSVLVERLRSQGSVTMANGLPLGLYLDLLSPRDETPAMPSRRMEDFFTLLSWRRRALRIAREDVYHWESTLDPAALIDFDLVALFVSCPIPELVQPWRSADSDSHQLELLPMIIADRLRGVAEGRRPV